MLSVAYVVYLSSAYCLLMSRAIDAGACESVPDAVIDALSRVSAEAISRAVVTAAQLPLPSPLPRNWIKVRSTALLHHLPSPLTSSPPSYEEIGHE